MKKVAVGVGHRCHPLSPFPVGRLVNDRRAILPQTLHLTINVVGVKPEVHSAELVWLFRLRQPNRQVTRVTTRNAASPSSGKR
jgi:hypothetical protein